GKIGHSPLRARAWNNDENYSQSHSGTTESAQNSADKASFPGINQQPGLKKVTPPMQPGTDGADRNIQHIGNLFVSKSFNITQKDYDAEIFGKIFEGPCHVIIHQ